LDNVRCRKKIRPSPAVDLGFRGLYRINKNSEHNNYEDVASGQDLHTKANRRAAGFGGRGDDLKIKSFDNPLAGAASSCATPVSVRSRVTTALPIRHGEGRHCCDVGRTKSIKLGKNYENYSPTYAYFYYCLVCCNGRVALGQRICEGDATNHAALCVRARSAHQP
jgi:hypothetical protein